MPTAEAEKVSPRASSAEARYRMLVERCGEDIRLTHDLALALKIPYSRLQRIIRARREFADELLDLEKEKAES
jgi:hypothetical protein